jgi:hypothetical protein
VKLAISKALLLLLPSTYSEIKISFGVEVPSLVVSQLSLLLGAVFWAASFAKIVKQNYVFAAKPVTVIEVFDVLTVLLPST